MTSWAQRLIQTTPRVGLFSFSLNRAAGTYDVCTASGRIVIFDVVPYNDVAGAGLTSVSFATDDTTPTTVLASTALAALTGGKPLAPLASALVLPSGKKIRGTIVGTGTGGTVLFAVRYAALSDGASLS